MQWVTSARLSTNTPPCSAHPHPATNSCLQKASASTDDGTGPESVSLTDPGIRITWVTPTHVHLLQVGLLGQLILIFIDPIYVQKKIELSFRCSRVEASCFSEDWTYVKGRLYREILNNIARWFICIHDMYIKGVHNKVVSKNKIMYVKSNDMVNLLFIEH